MNSSVSVDFTKLMSQFRGYQDPKRVRSDVTSVAKHYRSLVPKRGKLILNTGQECELLMLEGTLPIFYRRQQYHTPVEIYITESYPMSPPTCYVRPTAGLSLKKGHRHVDSSGLVYLPYLHEWAARTHNLVELCVNMSNVFGSEPPLFATPVRTVSPTSPPQSGGPSSPYAVGQQPPQPRPHSVTHGGQQPQPLLQPRPHSLTFGGPQFQSQEHQQILPAHGGQQQAPAPHVASGFPARPLPPRPSPEEIRKEKEAELTRKLQAELQLMYNQLRTEMDTGFETQGKLEDSRREMEADVEELTRRNKELQRLLQVAKGRLAELEAYLAERAKEGEPAVEDLIEPRDGLADKMLELVAENAAIEDLLYYMDVGVTDGVITVEVFLKEVRRLARKQFVARATMKKVEKMQRKVNAERAAFNAQQATRTGAGGGGGSSSYYPSLPPQQETAPGGRGYMSTPPPRYTPTPTGGDRTAGRGYPSLPSAGQSAWSVGTAAAGRGGYPTIGTGTFGRYGAQQGPYTQGR